MSFRFVLRMKSLDILFFLLKVTGTFIIASSSSSFAVMGPDGLTVVASSGSAILTAVAVQWESARARCPDNPALKEGKH